MKKYEIQHRESLKQSASISPLVIPLIIGIVYGTVIVFQGDITGAFAMFFLCLMFGLPLTYTITFALVLPMAIFLRKINSLTSLKLCLWCTLIGPVAFYLYIYLLNSEPERMFDIYGIIFSLICGFISGGAFCVIARIRISAN